MHAFISNLFIAFESSLLFSSLFFVVTLSASTSRKATDESGKITVPSPVVSLTEKRNIVSFENVVLLFVYKLTIFLHVQNQP